MPKLPQAEHRFTTYAFMGVNKTKLLPNQPDWIVQFLEPESFNSSEGGVCTWHKRNCPTQAGSVVKCSVVATEVSVVSAAMPTTATTRLSVGAKLPRGK